MATPETQEAASTLSSEDVQTFCELLDQMKGSMAAARDIVKSLREKYVLHDRSVTRSLVIICFPKAEHNVRARYAGGHLTAVA